MLFTDLVMARRRAAGLPAGDAGQRRLPAAVLADLHPHPGAARRAQRGRPRVLRRRHGGQDPRARGRGDRRGSPPRPRELRDEGIRAGRIRAAFDPLLEGLPNLGVLAVLGVGVLRVQHRRRPTPATSSRSPTCSPSWPSRSAPSAGCWGSSRARWSASSGCTACSTRSATPPTAATAAGRLDRGRRPRGRRPALHLRAGPARCSTASTSPSRRAARSRSSAPPPRARAP